MSKPSLSEILAVFNDPKLHAVVTARQFEEGCEAYMAEHLPDTGFVPRPAEVLRHLKTYLRSVLGPLVGAVSFPDLQGLVEGLSTRVVELDVIDYASFTLTKDLPNYLDVQTVLDDIFGHVTTASALRDECNHYSPILSRAIGFLTSLRKALEAFLGDPTVYPLAFSRPADRKAWAQPFLVDVDSYISRLNGLRFLVTNLHDNILGQRIELLKRSESAVRLLVNKVGQEDGFGDRLGARPGRRVTPPTERDIAGSGFEVETV